MLISTRFDNFYDVISLTFWLTSIGRNRFFSTITLLLYKYWEYGSLACIIVNTLIIRVWTNQEVHTQSYHNAFGTYSVMTVKVIRGKFGLFFYLFLC